MGKANGDTNGTTSPLDSSRVDVDVDGFNALRSKVVLPCGKVMPNCIAKVAMYESLASIGGGPPNEAHWKLYEAWGKGGWGMVITGNVMIDPNHQGLGQDVLAPTPSTMLHFARWARSIKDQSPSPPLAIIQLNHPGRQSLRCMVRPPWSPSLAPSPIPMNSGEGAIAKVAYSVAFGTPREVTLDDIKDVVDKFRAAAVGACEAGWDGVQVHCAHGYLLSQFLSPRTNHRSDAYGGSPEARIKLLLEIIAAIRASVPSSFCIGVKLNSKDYIKGGLSEEEALQHVRLVHEHGGVDFIEVSGGSYESPDFMALGNPESKPFFSLFAAAATSSLAFSHRAPLIMLTGNLRSRTQCAVAIRGGAAQLCGIARPAAVDPSFAAKLLDDRIGDNEAIAPMYTVRGGSLIAMLPVKVVGASVESFWHNFMLARIARGKELRLDLGFWSLFARHLLSSAI